MDTEGSKIAKPWQNPEFASTWAARDSNRTLLDFPRQLSAALIEHAGPRPELILDVASGPGDFLAAFLSYFPDAHGIWSDASPAMQELAEVQLARFGDRVTYQLVDMTRLDDLTLPRRVDAIITSRASHHLSPQSLVTFYAAAGDRLVSEGWIANLDHVTAGRGWDERFRDVRRALVNPQRVERKERGPSDHHHDQPAPTLADHFNALAAAGLADAEIAWKVCHTALLLARRPVAG